MPRDALDLRRLERGQEHAVVEVLRVHRRVAGRAREHPRTPDATTYFQPHGIRRSVPSVVLLCAWATNLPRTESQAGCHVAEWTSYSPTARSSPVWRIATSTSRRMPRSHICFVPQMPTPPSSTARRHDVQAIDDDEVGSPSARSRVTIFV